MSFDFSRRSFIAGSAMLAGAALAGSAATAFAAGSGTDEDMKFAATSEQNGINTSGPRYYKQDPSFFTAPAPMTEADCVETKEADVVIIGAGNSGCAAAASCVDNGLNVIVIEKLGTVQGRGGGIGLCNTKFTKEYGEKIGQDLTVNIEEAQHRWIRTCASRVKESLVSQWFNRSGEAGNWLIDKAAEYGVFPDSFRAYAPNAIIPESFSYHQFHRTADTPKFPAECSYFVATSILYVDSQDAEKHGGVCATYDFYTCAQQLVKDNQGRVDGVVALNEDGDYVYYRGTKGVIIATGGIDMDQEMVDYYCEPIVRHCLENQNSPAGYSTGDGIKMGLWAGAAVQGGDFPLMLHPQAGCMFHGAFMFVNKEGQRFCNEGTWVQGKSMNVMRQTDNMAWSIFDANYGEQNVKTLENGVGGGMFWDSMGGEVGDPFKPEDVTSIVDSAIAADNGTAYKADTLLELAKLINVDPVGLQESVDRYNELVAQGVDTDFHKQADFLFPVVEPPFYAAKVGVALLAIVGGLEINNKMQVLTKDRQIIPGLYATGNASGDLYAVDYPINMAGNSNGRCLTWGYLLGQILAGVDDIKAEMPPTIQGDVDGDVPEEAAGGFKDGVYEATGKGIGGKVPLTVTIEGGKIVSVEVGANGETMGIGSKAIEKLPALIVEAQGIEGVDGVSGASVTSKAIFTAMADILEQAQA
ncbi:MAG: FAD-binding protein [Coriobacteriales bacterium]|nr:FAD-binding protein [Coriobacteriales bacterium]